MLPAAHELSREDSLNKAPRKNRELATQPAASRWMETQPSNDWHNPIQSQHWQFSTNNNENKHPKSKHSQYKHEKNVHDKTDSNICVICQAGNSTYSCKQDGSRLIKITTKMCQSAVRDTPGTLQGPHPAMGVGVPDGGLTRPKKST